MQLAGLAEKLELGAEVLELALEQGDLQVGDIGAGQFLVAGIGMAVLLPGVARHRCWPARPHTQGG